MFESGWWHPAFVAIHVTLNEDDVKEGRWTRPASGDQPGDGWPLPVSLSVCHSFTPGCSYFSHHVLPGSRNSALRPSESTAQCAVAQGERKQTFGIRSSALELCRAIKLTRWPRGDLNVFICVDLPVFEEVGDQWSLELTLPLLASRGNSWLCCQRWYKCIRRLWEVDSTSTLSTWIYGLIYGFMSSSMFVSCLFSRCP